MTVYVDDMRANYGRLKMCQMMADTTQELIAMADQIGVARKWLQFPGSHREHFDISLSKRALAVRAGAVEVTRRQMGALSIVKQGSTGCRSLAHARKVWSEVDG